MLRNSLMLSTEIRASSPDAMVVASANQFQSRVGTRFPIATKPSTVDSDSEHRHTPTEVWTDSKFCGPEDILQQVARHVAISGNRTTASGGLSVTVSYAQALCGSIASTQADSDRLILSGKESMQFTHQLRSMHDMILVGINTVLKDNPRLSVRLCDGESPLPVFVDSQLRTPLQCNVLSMPRTARTTPTGKRLVILTRTPEQENSTTFHARKLALENLGAEIVICESTRNGHVDVADAFRRLSKYGSSVMVEGGSQIISSVLQCMMADDTGVRQQAGVRSCQVVITQANLFVRAGVAAVSLEGGGQNSTEGLASSTRHPSLLNTLVARQGDDVLIYGVLFDVSPLTMRATPATNGTAAYPTAPPDGTNVVLSAVCTIPVENGHRLRLLHFEYRPADGSGHSYKIGDPVMEIPVLCSLDVGATLMGTAPAMAQPGTPAVGERDRGLPLLIRVHDQCFTSEVLGSRKCDCKEQLSLAIDTIAEQGGAVIYMPQEGRGIGLSNKIKAYHLQETEGLDTVDANRALGLPDDARSYDAVPGILKTLGVPPGGSIRLLTNNPRKVRELEKLGVTVAAMVPCVVESNAHNSGYLHAKSTRMDHHLPHATCTHGTSSALKSKL
eukprot:m.283234 g.283234  ORF g.283234 m.283234 type:complete len:616 (-) comp19874_c0_seq2:103-1950(-)